MDQESLPEALHPAVAAALVFAAAGAVLMLEILRDDFAPADQLLTPP